MKWRRKKSNASSSSSSYYASSGPFLISHVLPNSWLTKFKQMSIKPGKRQAKANQKGKQNSGSVSSPRLSNCRGEGGGRFYGGDGDAFWRLSFGDDSADDGEKKRAVFRHVRYDSFNETEFPPSSCRSRRSNAAGIDGKEDTKKLSNTVSGARKMRGLQTEDDDNPPEIYSYTREKVAEIRTPRLKIEGEKLSRKRSQKVSEEKQVELYGEARTRDAEEVVVKSGTVERQDCRFPSYISSMDSNEFYSKKIEEDSLFVAGDESDGFSVDNLSSEWQKLKEMKIEEVKPRNEKQRKSLYVSRELQRSRPKQNIKVRECSPRTASRAEICKIKALEDMKMAKLKTMKKKKKKKKKKRRKEKEEKSMEEGLMGLESFAVVKVSMDPQKDFRDSMVEMIQERRISRPEEFEELLACYLTLNSDEYHHLIIKVFRQVWFDLNQACSNPGLQDDQCYYDY